MQSILNLRGAIGSVDGKHVNKLVDISDLQQNDDGILFKTLKMVQELKKSFFSSLGKLNILKKNDAHKSKESIQKDLNAENGQKSNLHAVSLSSEITLTHEFVNVTEKDSSSVEDLDDNTNDDDKSDAASFITACDEWDENEHHRHVCPAIILPDFSFASFMKAIVAIQANLGDNDAVKHLIPMKHTDEKQKDGRIQSNKDSFSSATLSSSLSVAASPPLSAQKSIFASSLSYLYSKIRNVLPSSMPSVKTVSMIAGTTKELITTRLQKKMEGLPVVANILPLTHTLVKGNISKGDLVPSNSDSFPPTAFAFASSLNTVAGRISPKYAYQICFLVKKYGLKETANILARN